MPHQKFDPAKLDRLNDPARLERVDPSAIWAALGEPQPSAVAEIGAGTGLYAAAFSRLAPGATVYAVDSEPVMVEWMRESRREVRDGTVVAILSEETHIPLDDDTVQVATMLNLHHELADPDAIYAEAARILAPGGVIAVADWAPREMESGPPLHVRVGPDDLVAALRGAGFVEATAHPGLETHSLVTAHAPRAG